MFVVEKVNVVDALKPLNGGSDREKEVFLLPCLCRSEGTLSSLSCTCAGGLGVRWPAACAVVSWPDPVLLLTPEAAVPVFTGRPSAPTRRADCVLSFCAHVIYLQKWR